MTKIIKGKYWDKSLNPIEVKDGGWHCTKVSTGCLHCWAEQQNLRFGNKLPYDNQPVEYVLNEKILQQPLSRKIPTTYFVCDLCDLFHEKVPDRFIGDVFETIRRTPQHIYQILTKRVERMGQAAKSLTAAHGAKHFNHVQWGVSISTQAEDWKIAELLKISAAMRFVSLEPLLGEINMKFHLGLAKNHDDLRGLIKWLIIGCESINGRAGRFQDGFNDAAINLVGQCDAARVPPFVKQVYINGKVEKDINKFPPKLQRQEMPE